MSIKNSLSAPYIQLLLLTELADDYMLPAYGSPYPNPASSDCPCDVNHLPWLCLSTSPATELAAPGRQTICWKTTTCCLRMVCPITFSTVFSLCLGQQVDFCALVCASITSRSRLRERRSGLGSTMSISTVSLLFSLCCVWSAP